MRDLAGCVSLHPPYDGDSAMVSILRQREIIDRRALADELAQVVAEARAPATDRAVLLPPLKAALAHGRDEIRRRFEAGGPAARAVAEQSFLIDQLIRALYDLAIESVYPLANPTAGREDGDRRGRRLWARRAGAVFRHRSAVPAALQAHAA